MSRSKREKMSVRKPANDLSQIPPLRPLPHHLIRHVPSKNMHMINPPHTLQNNPILKPHHLLPPPRQILRKIPIHKLLYQLPRLRRDISSCGVHGNERFSPDQQVEDIGGETVGPVVHKHSEIMGICKGRAGVGCECWWAGRRWEGCWSPEEALLDYESSYAAVLLLDGVGPGEVAAEIGREAF